jgi:lipopolysaccharide transport system ATP-binding protein
VGIIEQNPFVLHFHEFDVAAFNVVDPMDGRSARGNYILGFPGMVRPILNWNTSRVDKNFNSIEEFTLQQVQDNT